MEKEEIIYNRLTSQIGQNLATFCACAVFDVAFDPDSDAKSWREYEDAHKDRRFAEGNTDVQAAIRAGMDQGELWEMLWGVGNEEHPYTERDYIRLDELYETMTSQLNAAGGLIDKQQEDAARFCSLLALKREKRVAAGGKEDIQVAKDLDKMIRDNLADCNMRKKDQLPTQKQRPDGFIDALRRKSGLGADMTQEQVVNFIFNCFKAKKYDMTTDAADHAILAIMRTMAKNDDRPEPMELEPDMSLAAFEMEFADEPNGKEENAYEYFGLVRGGAGGKKRGEKHGAQD